MNETTLPSASSPVNSNFVGRDREVDTFRHWLTDAHAPRILYIHDSADETDKKGGSGKTWLLGQYAEIAKQNHPDMAVVMADFFNRGDRDRIFLAEKVVAGLNSLYPDWQPRAFLEAVDKISRPLISSSPQSKATSAPGARESVALALANDLQRLDSSLAEQNKTLLVLFDTYEMIEENPTIAVLRPSHTFPDNYQYPAMRVVIAGRNKLDWHHPNWQGREQEVQVITLAPFDLQELREYVAQSPSDISPESDIFKVVYEQTQGRPILVRLALDLLNSWMAMNKTDVTNDHTDPFYMTVSPEVLPNVLSRLGLEQEGVLANTSLKDLALFLVDQNWQKRLSAVRTLRTLESQEAEELLLEALQDENEFVRMTAEHALDYRHRRRMSDALSAPKNQFERHLVEVITKLESPLNRAILFMAHISSRCNSALLKEILERVPLSEPVPPISQDELVNHLLAFSFVRRFDSGDDLVLHDDVRKLVTDYGWEDLDPDHRFRKEISHHVIDHYERELATASNEQQRQDYIVGILSHRLYVDLATGLKYFDTHFLESLNFLKVTLAHLLLQEVQKFLPALSLAQQNQLQLMQARLSRTEENPHAALELLQQIEDNFDPQWYEENRVTLLLEKGRNYGLQSRLREAFDCYTQILEIERERGHERECARLLKNLGFICQRRGQFTKALSNYNDSLALYKKLGQPEGCAEVLNNMSHLYRLQGKTEEAIRRGTLAWLMRRKLVKEGKITEMQLGLSEQTLGLICLDAYACDLVKAEAHFMKAYDIYLGTNYKVGIATVSNHLGQLHINKGQLAEALIWLKKSEEIAQEIDKEQYIISLNKQARVKVEQQAWQDACSLLEQAIATARQVPAPYQLTKCLLDLAKCYLSLNLAEYAFEHLREAEVIATQEPYPSLLGLIEKLRGEHYYKLADYNTAFQHFAQYCHCMALYNTMEFRNAVRSSTKALMGVPQDVLPVVTQEILSYWHSHQLEESYPELVDALKELDGLMAL